MLSILVISTQWPSDGRFMAIQGPGQSQLRKTLNLQVEHLQSFRQDHHQRQTIMAMFFSDLSSKNVSRFVAYGLVSGITGTLITQALCCGSYGVSGSKRAKFAFRIHLFWCHGPLRSGISPHLLIKAFKPVSAKVGMRYFLASVSWKRLQHPSGQLCQAQLLLNSCTKVSVKSLETFYLFSSLSRSQLYFYLCPTYSRFIACKCCSGYAIFD